MRATIFLLWLALGSALNAQSSMPAASYADRQLDDPALEADAKELMETIRCLVCEGQSVADSDAEMAGDLRSLIRERVAAGERPDRIRDWLVERYGPSISYAPPIEPITWPLWGAPILFLAVGLWLARGRFRTRKG